MPSSRDQFYLAAARLKKAAPMQWDAFLAELQERHRTHLDNLVNSEPNALQQSQGYARHSAELIEELKGCQQFADRIMKRENV